MAGERDSISQNFDTNFSDADQSVDAQISGVKWGDTATTPITFSFTTSASDYSYNQVGTFSGAFDSTQRQATRDSLAEFSSVSNVTFTEITNDPSEGTLRFAEFSGIGTAYGYFPNDFESGGDIAFNNASYNSPLLGNYAFLTFNHEIGHAMGLKHGHETNGSGPMISSQDSMEYSVMTYNSFAGHNLEPGFYTNQSNHFAQTLMMMDIAAIQRMYGANFDTNSSDSIYTFSPSTGTMSINGISQGTPAANVLFRTVWDGDGMDTYDLSNYATNLRIDLDPGSYSDFDVGGVAQRAQLNAGWNSSGSFVGSSAYQWANGHLYNALQYNDDTRSLIENAIGGSGNDVIEGNAANNSLSGGSGSDLLDAGDGDDILNGGFGRDTLYGRNNNDLLEGGDNIDSLFGGAGNDTLFGGAGGDYLTAGSGENTLFGGTESDSLFGGAGGDSLFGGEGDDILSGGSGDDSLFGGSGSDIADYSFNRSSASVFQINGVVYVLDKSNNGEADRLEKIETIQFSDQSMAALSAAEFDSLRYIASYSDLIEALGADVAAGVTHYTTSGISEGRSVTFDTYSYLASYGDLLAAFGSDTSAAVTHYILQGYNEGRQITFDGLAYIASYSDLIGAYNADATGGASHYVQWGYYEGRKVTFNGLEYIASYSDLIGAYNADATGGASHYIQWGYNEGRQVTFNGLEYIASYSDLIGAFGADATSGANHFILFGSKEARSVTFDGFTYLASYLDLIEVMGGDEAAAIKHYISFGFSEGRSINLRSGLDVITAGTNGSGSADTLSGTAVSEILAGFGGNDTIIGNGGDDVIAGGDGDDSLYGGAGRDVLIAGPGTDLLFGGTEADTFQFRTSDETVKVIDFEDNVDTILFHGVAGVTDATSALTFATDVSGKVVFNFTSSGVLVVENTTKAQLIDDISIA